MRLIGLIGLINKSKGPINPDPYLHRLINPLLILVILLVLLILLICQALILAHICMGAFHLEIRCHQISYLM